MQRLLIILLALSWSYPLLAQTFHSDSCRLTISGYVYDEHNGEAMSFSKIEILGTKLYAIADANGFYEITQICPGTYQLVCQHYGCDPVLDTLNLFQNMELNFYPEHHAKILEEISILGEQKKEQIVATNQIDPEILNRTSGLSLADGLNSIAGVSSINTGNSIAKPVIHGLHGNRILILNNGIRHEAQQWGNEHAPEIDPFVAGEIEVVKGASGVRYGSDAIGGVILINPKPFKTEAGIDALLNFGGMSNGRQGVVSATVDGNFAKIPAFSWRLQGTLNRAGNFHAPSYMLKNTGFSAQNFSWSAQFKKPKYGLEVYYSQVNTKLGIFSAAHIGNLTDLQNAFESPQPLETADFTYAIGRPYQLIAHELFKAKGYLRTGDLGRLVFVYARQYNLRNEFDKHLPLNDSLAALNLPALHFEITTQTGELTWEHRTISQFQGEIGISGILQRNTCEGRFFIPNFQKTGIGAFIIERWTSANAKLLIEMGARIDRVHQQAFMWKNDEIYDPELNFQQGSGTLGLMYRVSKEFKIKVNAGTAWRPPNVNELYSNGLHHGASAIEIGNPNLNAERAIEFTTSLSYHGKKLRINADFYAKAIQNFIYLRPTSNTVLTIVGAYPTFAFEQVDAVLRGLDLTASYAFNPSFSFEVKGAMLRATNSETREFLVLMPADRLEGGFTYHFKETNKLKKGYVTLSVQHVFEQTRVPDNSDFAPPPAAFTLVNAYAGTNVWVKNTPINLSLSVNNVFNTSYRDYLNRFRYFTDNIGRNIMVNCQIPIQFGGKSQPHEAKQNSLRNQ